MTEQPALQAVPDLDSNPVPIGAQPLDQDKPGADDEQMWSVTTIIKALDQGQGLMYWACERSAVAAVHRRATWEGYLADCERNNATLPDGAQPCRHADASCEAVKWLRDARYRTPRGYKSDAELGTEVHKVCEEYAITGTRPEGIADDVMPFVLQFEEWCQRAQPIYHAAEVTVYHRDYGYAGTCDGFMEVQGRRCIFDYKTSRKSRTSRGDRKSPYSEIALQLAAYSRAQFAAAWRPRRFEKYRRRYYLLGPGEIEAAQPIPDHDHEVGLGILITPEFCDAWPVAINDEVHTSFLYAIEAQRWKVETSRTAVADGPLTF